MRCHASVDRIEGKYAVCEVEVNLLQESIQEGEGRRETVVLDIPLQEIYASIGEVEEGDILVIECNENGVTDIFCKDEEEKKRRLEMLKLIMG